MSNSFGCPKRGLALDAFFAVGQLLHGHLAPHERKVSGEGADVFVVSRFLGSGKDNGVAFAGAQEFRVGQCVALDRVGKGIQRIGPSAQGLLTKGDGGDAFLQDDDVVPHGNLWNLAHVLQDEFYFRAGFHLERRLVVLHHVIAGDGDGLVYLYLLLFVGNGDRGAAGHATGKDGRECFTFHLKVVRLIDENLPRKTHRGDSATRNPLFHQKVLETVGV